MENERTHEIELEGGFTDSKGATHKELLFTHRLTGRDLANLDRVTDGLSPEVVSYFMVARALTRFGSLRQENFVDALLTLDTAEYAEVEAGHDLFLSRTTVLPEFFSETTVRLGFGLKRDETLYHVVTFGKGLHGYDLLNADKRGLTGVARNFYLLGLQIAKVETSDGQSAIDGPLTIEDFYGLDVNDIGAIRKTAELWNAHRRNELKSENPIPGEAVN